MKLLIADDEDIIRRGLTGLDWETVGITEVRSVENGMDALQCVPRWQPDIILTDINLVKIQKIHPFFSKKREKWAWHFTIVIESEKWAFLTN